MLTPEERMIGRRSFLKAMAALPAVGAFAWAAYVKRRHDRPLQVGIIGTGGEGRVLLEQAPVDLMQVKAVADIRPDSQQKAVEVIKKRWGAEPTIYADDYRQLLDRGDLEAVLIATPLWMHAPMTVDALNAGKHVFCEKTMAYDLEGSRKMAEAARRNGRVLQIGHQRRSNPLYHSAREIIRQGLLGEIYHVRTLWHRNNDWRRPVPTLAELRKANPKFDPQKWNYGSLEELVNWRLYRQYSQGLMAELGSHQLDVADWFHGAPPKRLSAMGGIYRYKDGRTVADHVYVTCEYPAGKLSPNGLTVTFTSIQSNKLDNYYEQFMGTKGTIILSGEVEAMLFAEDQDTKTEIEVTRAAGGAPMMEASRSRVADASGAAVAPSTGPATAMSVTQPYANELKAFWAAIKQGIPSPCDSQVALPSAVVVLKANEAIEHGGIVDLPPELYAI
jgi:predicted dehydrogenase